MGKTRKSRQNGSQAVGAAMQLWVIASMLGMWAWYSQACPDGPKDEPPPSGCPTSDEQKDPDNSGSDCACGQDSNKDPNGDCDDGTSGKQGTPHPIDLASGAVLEEANDLYLPGVLPWAHHRSYNSRMKAQSGYVLHDIPGKQWEAGATTAYLWLDTNTNDVTLYWGAAHSVLFAWHSDSSTWRAKHGSQLKLSRDQFYLAAGDNTWYYVVRFSKSDKILVFHTFELGVTPDRKKGSLHSITSRYSEGNATPNRMLFNFYANEADGRITSITTCQGWTITYRHSQSQTNLGRQTWAVVLNGSNAPLSAAVNIYHENHDAACGSGGDLVLVYSCQDVVGYGNAAAAQGTDLTLTDLRPGGYTYENSTLNGCKIILVDGANAGHARTISSNTGNTISFASGDGFGSAVSSGTGYVIARAEVKTTHYRYYNADSEDGKAHQLKMVLGPAAVERLLAMSNCAIKSAGELLGKTDSDHLANPSASGDTVKDYADKFFTYYTGTFTTATLTTAWNQSQGFLNAYGMEEIDETGRVKTELVGAGCASCSGGAGIKYTYYHGAITQSPTSADKVSKIVVEDATGTPAGGQEDALKVRRTIYGLNAKGVMLRKVVIADPDNSTPSSLKYWCESWLVDALDNKKNGQVTEHRLPSAHTGVDTDAEVAQFLNPTSGSPTTNDEQTRNDGSGLYYKYYYWYDTNDAYPNYYLRDTTVREGHSGTEHMVSSSDCGDGIHKQLPTATYTYPTSVVYSDDRSHLSSGVQTTYAYGFYSDNKNKLQTRTVTYPKVPTGENGGGDEEEDAAFTSGEYYDQQGRLRWSRDAEGTITYYAYHTDLGGLAYKLEDAKTDSLPNDVTNPSGNWDDWADNGGNAPTNFTNTNAGLAQMVTKTEFDGFGRPTKNSGPLSANGSLVAADEPITYMVYLKNEVRVYSAWSSTTDMPLLPVSVTVTTDAGEMVRAYSFDPLGQNVEIEASNHAPTGADTVPLGAWSSLTRRNYDSKGRLASEDRFYDIPHSGDPTSSGFGTSGTHFLRTEYGYDDLGRRNKVTAPDLTVAETVFDNLGRATETKVGMTNHMVTVAKSYYDEVSSGVPTPGSNTEGVGDGNVTQRRDYYGSGGSDYYATLYKFDFRNRLEQTRGNDKITVWRTLDYMGRATTVETYYDSDETPDWTIDSGELISKSSTQYDKLGRVFRSSDYNVVEHSAGSNTLTTDYWYDGNGRQVKAKDPNGLFAKTKYDGLGRATASYVCYDDAESSYDDAKGLTSDTVVEQAEYEFDKAGNAVSTTSYQRKDNGSGTGALTTNNARRTYAAQWYDRAGRLTGSADYGAIATINRPSSVPDTDGTTTRDVTKYEYGFDGTYALSKVTDNRGKQTWKFADDLGRTRKVVENYDDGDYEVGDDACDRTTLYNFDGAGHLASLQAKNPKASTVETQTTTYIYDCQAHTTPAIYRNDLVWAVIYPDSSDTYNSGGTAGQRLTGTDHVEYTYDRLGRKTTFKDQRTIKHEYLFDSGGRLIVDRVVNGENGQPSWPAEVQGDYKAITRKYDNFEALTKVTSHSDAATDPDNEDYPVDQVTFQYDGDDSGDKGWGGVKASSQAHDGLVTSGSAKVEYAFEDGLADNQAKYVRLASVTYPGPTDARKVVHYNYSTSGDGQRLSRLETIADDTSTYAHYGYFGAGTIFKVEHPAASTNGLTLDYDTGGDHTYAGLDVLGRVVNQRWKVGTTVVDQYSYGYDGGSRRLWKRNLLAEGSSKHLDELYAYDDLDRLTSAQRGDYDGSSLTNKGFGQEWGLEALGNWKGFKHDTNGDGTWDLNQTRDHNPVNETTGITRTTGDDWKVPDYDNAGNMKKGPKAGDETTRLHFRYDAWNRLTKVYADDGGNPAANPLAVYHYDGLNRRTRKSLGGENYYDYYYSESWQVLEERKTQDDDHPYAQYVWDVRYIDAPVLRWHDGNTDGTIDDTLYYCNDANMNVTAVVDGQPGSGTRGSAVERYVYDPYGRVTIYDSTWANTSGASSFDNQILYCGYRFDQETGMYLARERYYHPSLGKWNQEDPSEEGLNTFEYVESSPLVFLDPYGLFSSKNTLFSKDEHGPLTTSAFDEAFPLKLGKPLTPREAECRGHAHSTIQAGNKWQDNDKEKVPATGKTPFKENFRHYNRDMDQTAAEGRAAYRAYLAQEKRNFTAQLRKVKGRCDNNVEEKACDDALWILGRMSHSWQDYFAHAVLLNGEAGPAWGAKPQIRGTPDKPNPKLKPSSWGWSLDPGEHDWPEPWVRDPPLPGYPSRWDDAVEFVAGKFQTYLRTWYNKCRCCCPPWP